MRDDPGFDLQPIAAALRLNYGVDVETIRFLPIGFDLDAYVYDVRDGTGSRYFLKIRLGEINEPALAVSRWLIDQGVGRVLAPIRTRSASLWSQAIERADMRLVLYPFIDGDNAQHVGLSDVQWREFGKTLRAVHDAPLDARISREIARDEFDLPSAKLVRDITTAAQGTWFSSPAAERFGRFWRDHRSRIEAIVDRAAELGDSLRVKPFRRVLCHADIHAANILVEPGGAIWLIDWDGPIIAPRERDLFFIIGSRIARRVTLQEEEHFFAGYGNIEIDPQALFYFRYERMIEDLGEFGKSVFFDASLSEDSREAHLELALGLFEPGGDVDNAERLTDRPWLRFPGENLRPR